MPSIGRLQAITSVIKSTTREAICFLLSQTRWKAIVDMYLQSNSINMVKEISAKANEIVVNRQALITVSAILRIILCLLRFFSIAVILYLMSVYYLYPTSQFAICWGAISWICISGRHSYMLIYILILFQSCQFESFSADPSRLFQSLVIPYISEGLL